jgi:hypothetical protein
MYHICITCVQCNISLQRCVCLLVWEMPRGELSRFVCLSCALKRCNGKECMLCVCLSGPLGEAMEDNACLLSVCVVLWERPRRGVNMFVCLSCGLGDATGKNACFLFVCLVLWERPWRTMLVCCLSVWSFGRGHGGQCLSAVCLSGPLGDATGKHACFVSVCLVCKHFLFKESLSAVCLSSHNTLLFWTLKPPNPIATSTHVSIGSFARGWGRREGPGWERAWEVHDAMAEKL